MAYLEPEASLKVCQTFKIVMHIQSPRIVKKAAYSNIFKDI